MDYKMEQDNRTRYIEEQELTLKELMGVLKEYSVEILYNKKIVLFIMVIVGVLFGGQFFIKPNTYRAKMTFMLNEDEGGKGSAIASVLGQFGIPGSKSEFNLAKILELSKSRRIIQRSIFKKMTIDEKDDFLANHIIRLYDFHETWKDSQHGLTDFLFTEKDPLTFSKLENRALKTIVTKVIGNAEQGIEGLFYTSLDEGTSIMDFSVISVSEPFSIELVKHIYLELSEFYVEKSIERQKKTYDLLDSKVDSLSKELSSKQYQLLNFEDTNRGLTLNRYKARKLGIQTDIQILGIAYGKAIENMQVADFSLKNSTPFFQEIDYPIAPLAPSYTWKVLLKKFILGTFIGGFIAIASLIIRKLYRDSMEEA